MAIDYFPGIDAPEPVANDSRRGVKKEFFGKDGFNFFDFLDIINPLQHIPILSGLYRKITGDEISPAARRIGGGLFGGPIGFAAAVANVAVEDASGTDIGGHVFQIVGNGGQEPDTSLVQVAGADTFGVGAGSGADASPAAQAPNFPTDAPLLSTAAAARSGLFALSLDIPAGAYEVDSSRAESEPPGDEDALDRLRGGNGVRVVDLSAEQLVQIFAQFQRGTGASLGLAGPGGAWPPAQPGSLSLQSTLD